jgi:hypothetical protein
MPDLPLISVRDKVVEMLNSTRTTAWKRETDSSLALLGKCPLE